MESLNDGRSSAQEADRHTYTFADLDQGNMLFSMENGWLQILQKKGLCQSNSLPGRTGRIAVKRAK